MSLGANSQNLAVGLLIGGLFVAYAALSHYISTLPEGTHWGAAIAIAPVLAMGLDMGRRSLGKLGLGLATLLSLAATILVWPYLKANVDWVYFLQHIGMNASLGLMFGRSLLRGRQPVCSFFATFTHNPMSAAVASYTRHVTMAWSLFFLAMVATSVLLFFLAPLETWSVFANLLTMPLVGLMFVLEHLARKMFLPPEDQLAFTALFRAFYKARQTRQMPVAPETRS